jgi:hypothetical protein
MKNVAGVLSLRIMDTEDPSQALDSNGACMYIYSKF